MTLIKVLCSRVSLETREVCLQRRLALRHHGIITQYRTNAENIEYLRRKDTPALLQPRLNGEAHIRMLSWKIRTRLPACRKCMYGLSWPRSIGATRTEEKEALSSHHF